MKIILLLFSLTICHLTIATQTQLSILNLAKSDVVNTVAAVDDEADWESGSGPQRNFQAVQIPSGKAVQNAEYVKDYAPDCPFTMTLQFADGSVEMFKINQKFAIGEAPPNFLHQQGNRNFKYESLPPNVLMVTVEDKTF